MEITIKKRNILFPIIGLIHFLIFLSVTIALQDVVRNYQYLNAITDLDSARRLINGYSTFYNEYLGWLLSSGLLIIIIILLYFRKKIKRKYLLGEIVFFASWAYYTLYESTLLYEGGGAFADILEEGNHNFIHYILLFSPYIFLIVKCTIFGESHDITEKVQKNKNEIFDSSTEELDKLLALKVLSEEEYQIKKTHLKKEKIRDDMDKSEEYKLLKSLHDKGILTNEEFENKIQILVDEIQNGNF